MLFAVPFLVGRVNDDSIVGAVMAVPLLVVGIACGVGNFVIARGLSQRKKWAWIAGVVVGCIYAPSGCVPFGVVVLYALLRTGVKDAYEAEAKRASA